MKFIPVRLSLSYSISRPSQIKLNFTVSQKLIKRFPKITKIIELNCDFFKGGIGGCCGHGGWAPCRFGGGCAGCDGGTGVFPIIFVLYSNDLPSEASTLSVSSL